MVTWWAIYTSVSSKQFHLKYLFWIFNWTLSSYIYTTSCSSFYPFQRIASRSKKPPNKIELTSKKKNKEKFYNNPDSNKILQNVQEYFFIGLTFGYVSTGISNRKILFTVNELGLAGALCQSIVIPGFPLNLGCEKKNKWNRWSKLILQKAIVQGIKISQTWVVGIPYNTRELSRNPTSQDKCRRQDGSFYYLPKNPIK